MILLKSPNLFLLATMDSQQSYQGVSTEFEVPGYWVVIEMEPEHRFLRGVVDLHVICKISAKHQVTCG